MNTGSRKTKKPFIIPVFLPHAGCPNRCVFCDQTAITGEKPSLPSAESLCEQVNSFVAYKNKTRKNVQIAFYGGNFLGLAEKNVRMLLEEAAAFVRAGKVDSIRFSTRPDTIDAVRLNWLKAFPISAIELGVQSMDDSVLTLSNRGHTAKNTQKAVELLKEKKYQIGLQLMLGLPGDNEARAVKSAQKTVDLSPDFVRIYPTVVLKNSPLARLFQRGEYQPLSLEAAVSLAKKFYRIFEARGIPVIRMGLQSSEELDAGTNILAGPYHPAFGQLVYADFFLDKARSLLQNLKNSPESISIQIHPRSLSRLQGIRNQNIMTLKKEFGLQSIAMVTDNSLAENELKVV
ncbi:MAG: radical SAM protein [Desulfobacterales bacterium]|nr:radical SAM protein [Desulfobacterales bacterium]